MLINLLITESYLLFRGKLDYKKSLFIINLKLI